jgi:hypothetical protein
MKTKNTWLIGAAFVVIAAALFTGCSNPETEYVDLDLDSITISQAPAKLSYGRYVPFTSAGLEVSAHFNDGSAVQMVSGFTLSWNGQPLAEGSNAITGGPGWQEITVTWRGKSAVFKILVTGDNSISGIGTKSDWNAAIQAIKAGGDGQAYVLTINGDFEVDPSGENNLTFGTVKDLTVTLQGSGKLSLNGSGNIFHLRGNSAAEKQTLNLYGDITLEGRKVGGNGNVNNNTALVFIRGFAAFDMKNGTITGNSNPSGDGGGVRIYYTNGIGGSFTMSGGKITGNSASSGGGVYGDHYSSFTMSGGEISGNTASVYGGGAFFSSSVGSFSKSGNAIIYGDNDNIPYPTNGNATDNTVTGGNNRGNAVYVISAGKRRESTALAEVDLGYSSSTPTGAWEY